MGFFVHARVWLGHQLGVDVCHVGLGLNDRGLAGGVGRLHPGDEAWGVGVDDDLAGVAKRTTKVGDEFDASSVEAIDDDGIERAIVRDGLASVVEGQGFVPGE